MWGKRYNRGGDHGKHWYIWVSSSAANLFCLCSVSEMSRMCLCRQVRESLEAVDFSALSLMSRQIKSYLPLFSALESCGAFPPVRRFAGLFQRSRVNSRRSVRWAFWGAFGRSYGRASEGQFFPHASGLRPQTSAAFAGGRKRSNGANEGCRLRRHERCGVCDAVGQAERPAVRLSHPPAPKGCFGRQPVPTSAQSPHRLKRPAGEGISNSAFLRLLLPTKSFNFAGNPNITKGRQL